MENLISNDQIANVSGLFFFISSALLSIHMFFGLIWLRNKSGKINFLILIFSLLSVSCLFFSFQNINSPFQWFIFTVFSLLGAIGVHLVYRGLVIFEFLKEFINYKLYIEIYAVLLGLIGTAISFLFRSPNAKFLLGLFTLAFILRLNWLILVRKKLYSIRYKDTVISKNPLISIVVIAYNEENYIGKLLESLRHQDYKKFEVIVVDDHSKDKTVPVVNSYTKYFPLKIVQKETKGIARSRNYGATFAKGELILFLDSDVVLPKDFLSKNIPAFKRMGLSLAFFDFEPMTDSSLDKFAARIYLAWLKLVQYFHPRSIGSCILIRKDIHGKVLFNETIAMSEDFDYIERAVNLGKFRIIRIRPFKISWRRFEGENRIILILKYLFFEFYRVFIGNIGKTVLLIVSYDFGKHSERR